MHSILILNAKGGSGKTTVATNLAGYYANIGLKTVLADYDPLGGAMDWVAQRPSKYPKIKGVPAFSSGLRIPRGTEILVIDAPSRTHGDQLVALMRKAHTVIIPVMPSPVDMRAARRFLAELHDVRHRVKTDVKLVTVASRVREGTRVLRDLEDYLHDRRLSGRRLHCLTILRQNANYLRAAERGLSIFEFAPGQTWEDRAYWAPLTRWLKGRASRLAKERRRLAS